MAFPKSNIGLLGKMFGKSAQEGSALYLLAIYKGKFGPLSTFILHFPQDFIILFSKFIVWSFQKVAQTSGENIS